MSRKLKVKVDKRLNDVKIGDKIGYFTLLKRIPPNQNKVNTSFLCKCICGVEKEVLWNALKSGNTKSCGCIRKDNPLKLPKGEAAFNQLFYRYTKSASFRGLMFSLSKERLRELTK